MQEKELSIILSGIGWVLAFIGGLAAVIGGLIGYMFSKHREDNDCEHSEIKDMVGELRTEIREDINRIHQRIDDVLIGEYNE